MLPEIELLKNKKIEKEIKIALRPGYPNSYHTTKDVICCSNGCIYFS